MPFKPTLKAFFASDKAKNNVFNVACGERIDLNYLWDVLKSSANSELNAAYGPPRLGDVRDSLANIAKAQKLMGYQPQFTVREGLRITWNWFKNQ